MTKRFSAFAITATVAVVTAWAIVSMSAGPAMAAEDAKRPAAKQAGADDQLLKGLDDQLGDEGLSKSAKETAKENLPRALEPQPASTAPKKDAASEPSKIKASKAAPAAKKPAVASPDEELLKQLGEGDESGAPAQKDKPGADLGEQANPLTKIGAKMRAAETLIDGDKLSTKTTKLQGEIVHDIDELIKQMRKQCQKNGSCSSDQCKSPSPQQASTRSQVEQPKQQSQSKPSPAQQATQQQSKTPARTSQEGLKKAPPKGAVEVVDVREVMKKVWGDLPARDREQMQQAATEQFLPKYQAQIEKYFRRLAEEGETQP